MRVNFLLLMLGLLLVCCVCGCGANVSGSVKAGYTPPFVPITILIGSDGSIGLGAEQRVVTPIGTFSLQEDVTHNAALDDYPLALIIRHRAGGGLVDDVFQVELQEVEILLNGQTRVVISNRRVLVDASKGDVQSVVVRDARATGQDSRPTGSASISTPVSRNESVVETIEGAWHSSVQGLWGLVGKKAFYVCPPDGPDDVKSGYVLGTDRYDIRSSVCAAAVHAGKITLAEGGTVLLEVESNNSPLRGSSRHGIVSSDEVGKIPYVIRFI